jgi:serine/threonine-protein kinase
MNPKTGDDECPFCGYVYSAPYLPSYLAPGTVLNDRYIIGKLKSYNGESADYIAFDTITEGKVNIKEYMPDAICTRTKGNSVIIVDSNFVPQYKTLLSEFVSLHKTLSKMRSINHVTAVIDMFGDNNTGYAVFDCTGDRTLGDYLKENAGELSFEETKRMIPPILTTISLIHNAGIIHRGICPDNILVDKNNELVLRGFAISEVRTANTVLACDIAAGFAAPEQYSSSNWQDTWTDVYGISAVIYRMLTGITPVDAMTRATTDTLIAPGLINPGVPKHFSAAIMKGLALPHEMRIQTITELVTLLFDEPEWGSERLSSSSTLSITIPEEIKNAAKSNKLNPPQPKKPPEVRRKPPKKRVSRRKIFLATVGVTFVLGLLVLMVIWLIGLEDTSKTEHDTAAVLTGEQTGFSTFRTIPPVTTTTSAPVTTAAAETTNAAPSIIMDNITGKYYEIISTSEAYSRLVFNPVYVYSETVGKGFIISQSIPADTVYKAGDTIDIEVSLGSKFVVIPDFIGLTAADYFTLLNERGIKYEEQKITNSGIMEGYVADIDPDPGMQLDIEEGQTLIVFVAEGAVTTPATTTEPLFPGFGEEEDYIPDFTDDLVTYFENENLVFPGYLND